MPGLRRNTIAHQHLKISGAGERFADPCCVSILRSRQSTGMRQAPTRPEGDLAEDDGAPDNPLLLLV
jgi:hypothetical protein